MKKIITILLTTILLTGCTNTKKSENETTIESLMVSNNYTIVDVRTEEEYNDGHIKDAINIPYDEIDENTELNKNNIIFVYCKSGGRSSIAEQTLTELGYTVYNLGAYESIDLEKE